MFTRGIRSPRSVWLALVTGLALIAGLFIGVAPAQAVGSTVQTVVISTTCVSQSTASFGDTCVVYGSSKDGRIPTNLVVPVTVAPSSSGVCSLVQTSATAPTMYTITFNALGTCVLNATQAGDATYAAGSATKTFTVGAKALNISLDPLVTAFVGDTINFTPAVTGLVGTDAVSPISVTYGALGTYAGGTTPPTTPGIYTVTPSAATLTSGSASNYNITYGSTSYLCLAPVSERGNAGMCIEKVTTSPAARTVSFGLVNYTSGSVTSGTTVRALSYIKAPSSAQSTVSCTMTGTNAGHYSLSYGGGANASGGGGNFSASFSVSTTNNSGLLSVNLSFTSSASTGKVMCNWDGTGATVGQASYFSSVLGPSVTSISPTSGPSGGGTTITITGTKILAGATVTVGGSACTNVVVVPTTSLTCTTPSGAPGAVDVVVTNTDGTSVTQAGGYTQAVTVKPANSVLPAVTPLGAAAQGDTLTSTEGTWNYQGDPTTTTVTQWQLCSSTDASSCADIPGSTGGTLLAGPAVAGGYVRTSVAATNDAGTTTVYSNIVGPVAKVAQTISFTDPADTLWSATPVSLVASASSGFAVTLTSNTPLVCTVNGANATMVGAGTCSITATQAGTVAYAAATPVTQTFTISQATQTVMFADPADRVYSATPFTVSPTASSGLPVTVTASPSSVCTVSGFTVTMKGAGTCTLTATQAGNTGVSSASVIQDFVVSKADQTLVLNPSAAANLNSGATQALAVTGKLGTGAVTYVATPSGPGVTCVITGTSLKATGAGTCSVVATVATDPFFNADSTDPVVFTVSGANSVTYAAPTDKLLTLGGLTVAPTSSAALPVTLTSTTPSVCTVVGLRITFVDSGACTTVASQAGDSTHFAATSVTRTFNVAAAPDVPVVNAVSTLGADGVVGGSAAVTFTPGDTNGSVVSGYKVIATPTTGPAVTITCASSPCTVPGLTSGTPYVFTVTTVATAAGTAAPAVSAPTAPATPASAQTITFLSPGDVRPGVSAITVTPTSSVTSTFVPTTTSSTPAVCTVANNVVTVVTAGTCTLTASHPGGTFETVDYGAASASVSFNVTAAAPVITTGAILPPAVVGQAITSIAQAVTTGTATIPATGAWKAVNLPPGLSINPNTGAITGTPTTEGPFNNIVVSVTDAGRMTASKVFSMNIIAPPTLIAEATLVIAANSAIAAGVSFPALAGSSSSLTWTATGLSSVAGVSMSTSGVLSGTPTTPGVYPVVVTVTDGNGLTSVKTISVKVVAPPTVTTSSTAISALAGRPITPVALTAVKGAAVIPAKGAWTSENLPDGMRVDPDTGAITGSPDTAGSYTFTVTLTDANGLTASKTFTLTVGAPPVIETRRALPTFTLGGSGMTGITQTVTAGAASIPGTGAWALATGSTLPAGLALNPDTGAITGSPSVAGNYTFRITLTDAATLSDTAEFKLAVVAANVNKTVLNLPLEVADGVQVSTDLYSLTGTGESSKGLAVTYSTPVASDAVCFLDSQNDIHIIGAGTCTVIASSGSGTTLSTATQSFVVSKTPQELVITAPGETIPDTSPAETADAATDDPAGFILSVTATSGLTPLFAVVPAKDAAGKALAPNCKVDETGTVTWLYDLTLVAGKPGFNRNGNTCRIQVTQPGDKNFDGVKPQFIDLVATHNSSPSAGGALVADKKVISIPRKGGTYSGSQDSLAFLMTKTSVTAKPSSSGGYIGPIKATITVPYKVTVNGVLENRTQVCVINYGQIKPLKASDPKAFVRKVFATTVVCKFNSEAFSYFSAGNPFRGITFLVERDRRFATTYLKIDPGNGKTKPFPIVPTKRQYTINLG